MKPAIRVENLSKQYRISAAREKYYTLRESLMAAAAAPWQRLGRLWRKPRDTQDDTIWALKDVSCEIQRGEAIGIIGRNGAGKSTLLKILSRITEPTSGRAEVRGRVGSLLEIGAGFHLELTGRENIYLKGVIMGMTRKEVARKFDEIVAFSGIEAFLDTPMKRYSSGMYMRLAFAVAAHLEAEILIADEVLAVGDAAFQKKSLGKMDEVAHQGKTVLFVSHNLTAVQALCPRSICLHEGRVIDDGPTSQVVGHYLTSITAVAPERRWDDPAKAPGNDSVRLHRASIRPARGSPAEVLAINTPLELTFEYWNFDDGARLHLGFLLFNEQTVLVFNSTSFEDEAWRDRSLPAGLVKHTCVIPASLLNEGHYRVDLEIVKEQVLLIHREVGILVFALQDDMSQRNAWFGKWPGVVHPRLPWTTEVVQ